MTSIPATSSISQTAASTAATAAATTAATASASTLNYNDFLKLMVSELQNQDPTSPSDPTQYLSQLASFSQVEQQLNTNSQLSTMLTSQALTQADSTIGRTLTSADGTTSGTVTSVIVASNGALTANLANGQQMALNNGETMS